MTSPARPRHRPVPTAPLRTAVVLTAALALSAPLAQAPAAAQRAVARATQILNAGTTGFLWAQEGDDRLLWTAYTGGTTALRQRLPAPLTYDIDTGHFGTAASFEPGWYGDGSDTVALHSAEPSPRVTLIQGAGTAGDPVEVPLPADHAYQGTFGGTVLTRSGGSGGAPVAYHRWQVRNGTAVEAPVTGLPADARDVAVEDGDERSVVLRYRTADASDPWPHWGIVDLATGALRELPDRLGPDNGWEVSAFRLGRDAVLRVRDGRGQAEVYDRADLAAQPRSVSISSFSYQAAYGFAGSSLLAVEPTQPGNNAYRGQPLWAQRYDVENAPMRPVGRHTAHQIVAAPDGSVLVAGASAEEHVYEGDLDWGVYRVHQKADGALTRTRLTDVRPVPAQIHGLSLGSGVLTTADNSTQYEPSTIIGTYRSAWLSAPAAGGAPTVRRTTVDGRINGRDGDCSSGTVRCVRMFADGTGRHGRAEPTEWGWTVLRDNGSPDWGPLVETHGSSPRLTDLSGRYGIVDEASGGKQYVVEFPASGTGTVLTTRDKVAAAVWGDTLWSGARNGGTVSATRVRSGSAGGTGPAVESFTTRDGCTPATLQAVGRWVYWDCGDRWNAADSGVYDRTTRRTVTAPAGNVLLGDGYLVHHVEDGGAGGADGGLRLLDLSGGLPASGSSADLPVRTVAGAAALGQDGRAGVSWTVDRFGGGVAYADDQQRVHVAGSGTTASALSAIDSSAVSGPGSWSGSWWLSKPAADWELTLRHQGTGAVVRTVSGTEARGLLTAAWDGRDTAGAPAAPGPYAWSLTARPADGQGPDLTLTGAAELPEVPAPAARK